LRVRLAVVQLLLIALAIVSDARAQVWDRLGIFDDPAMMQPFGIMDGPMKSVWVGMPVGGPLGGLSVGYEFSVSGLDAFTGVLTRYPIAPNGAIGDVAAPPDTTTGSGGLNVAWVTCLSPGQAFLELVLIDPDPPQNHVLRVHKRFPPSSPKFPYPRAAPCDAPCFCVFTLRGEAYVLNPTIRTENLNWTAIKNLYRDR